MCCSLIMKVLAVFSCLLAVVAGYVAHDSGDYVYPSWDYARWNPSVVSKRESLPAPEPVQPAEHLFDLINQTLENATRGISGDDLKVAAQTFRSLATDILESTGANVSRDEVRSLVTELGAELGKGFDATEILNDPLTAQAKDVDTELLLLQKLREKGLSSEEFRDVILAAIVSISRALERSINTAEGIVWYLVNSSQQHDNEATRALHKRQWSLGVNGHYNNHHDWGVGASLTYKFGRR